MAASKTSNPKSAQVVASVVGRDCHIGRGARISGSYLLDGVVVHPGAQVSPSVVLATCHHTRLPTLAH